MRRGWEHRFVDRVLAWRRLVVAVVAALCVGFGVLVAGLSFDADIEIWFLDEDPSLVTYKAFLERFEADEVMVLGIFAEDVFTPRILGALHEITEEGEALERTHRVRSLTNVKVLARQGPGHVAVEALMASPPESAEEAAAIRAKAMASELLRDNLVPADGGGTAVVFELAAGHQDFDEKIAWVAEVRELVERHLPAETPGVTWHLGGSPPLDEAFMRYSQRDFAIFGPVSTLMVALVMFLLFRRWSATVIPLVVVGVAALCTFGTMAAIGWKMNLMSSGLLALILAVGVADSVHVISDWYREVAAGRSTEDAVREAIAELLLPCLFTSMTTAAGFLSLSVTNLQPTREFGVLGAIGVTYAFVVSMTLVPILLLHLPAPRAEATRDTLVGRWLARLARPRRPALTLAISTLLVGLGAWSLVLLSTEANPMNYFLPGDPVRVANESIDEGLGGSSSFEYLITTEPGGLKKPEVLEPMHAFAERLETVPGVTRVLSVVDSLREARRLLTDGESDAVPGKADHPHLAAQLYLFLEGDDDFTTYIQRDYAAARMTARIQLSNSGHITEMGDTLDTWRDELFAGSGATIEPTGFIKLMGDMEHYLFESQIDSMSLAAVVITLMMFLLLRSLRLGLFSMIPNFTPILLGLSFMALSGIALDPGTIMIGSMAMGLVVDDTVHFLARLRRNLDRNKVTPEPPGLEAAGEAAGKGTPEAAGEAAGDGDPLADAIARTMAQTGRPIISTSFVLAAGFGVNVLGSFTPNVAFGLVSAIVILMAMVADLVMLPAALLVIRPKV